MMVGLGVTLSTLAIQGFASALGAEAIIALLTRRAVGVHIRGNTLAMFALILMLLVGHLVQIAVWAIAFMAAREFAEFAVAFYHSAVNYTTLGYGDMVMSPRWRLLGPLEAAGGMLAFGWSTAVIVTVAIRLARVRHRAQFRSSAPPRSTTRGRFS